MDAIWGNIDQYQEIHWGWPIAMYLFLAGLSSGALISALLVKWSSVNDGGWDGLIKAGALIAPPAIVAGLGLLVLDLGRPLSFYLLMLYYQLTSVMSIGVILLLIYTPLTLVFVGVIFKRELADKAWFKPLTSLIETVEDWGKPGEIILALLAAGIATYTGFLLSALAAKPLFNVPVLPLLFLISGLSAGIAGNILAGLAFFREDIEEDSLRYLLKLDLKIIPFELFTLFLFFVGLYNIGGSYAIVAQSALTVGLWAWVFWLGVVGVGLLLPIIIDLTKLYGETLGLKIVAINSCLALVGVVLLRFYILYAGQIFAG